jgi:hypothetical protein
MSVEIAPKAALQKKWEGKRDNRFFLVIFGFQSNFSTNNEHIHKIRPEVDRR